MSKDKQSPFLAIKNYSFFVWGTVIYLTHDYLFLYSILAASFNYRSSVSEFLKIQKSYLTKCFVSCNVHYIK